MFEGSAVLWGANPNTPTLTVGKGLTKEEITNQHEKLSKELNMLIKSLKDGRFTDEAFEFILSIGGNHASRYFVDNF